MDRTDRWEHRVPEPASRPHDVVVAIHQPNFLPWLGYFDKLARSEVFVFLDSVQFPKKQGTWMNRVQILVQGAPHWLTVPVDRGYHGLRRVEDMRIAHQPPWRDKARKTLQTAYARAPFFDEVWPLLDDLLDIRTGCLADLNIAGVTSLASRLVDMPRTVRSSELGAEGSATDLLVDITKAVGGTTYLCGGGASDYQDNQRFEDEHLRLRYQDFRPPPYPQVGVAEHVPGLSAVDALFNVGVEGTAALLRDRGR